ncbi:hypothetical protein SADUNF_Sadunf02G0089500 [Salix dunnii]|uniref:Uncharacterized protein n=1 Tax=Salix dunnii TaxID=1413687 RepID=A0A835N6Y8_9ROSI|nr:hypothetical protein SADUNF_Sadunf02G0089500 [Salix dunnii]
MEMTVDGCVENRQMEEREHLRDNYVLQLQPFNLYPFSHSRNETVSLQERALAVSVRQQKHQPYHHHPPKQIEDIGSNPRLLHSSPWQKVNSFSSGEILPRILMACLTHHPLTATVSVSLLVSCHFV